MGGCDAALQSASPSPRSSCIFTPHTLHSTSSFHLAALYMAIPRRPSVSLLLSLFIAFIACSLFTIPPLRAFALSLSTSALRTTRLTSHLLPSLVAATGTSASRSLPPQPIHSMSTDAQSALQKATFAAGCFWSVELVYQREPGVMDTSVGYTGGSVKNPSYEAVCSGRTGHAEAVQVTYDPAKVTYGRLLDVFFDKHDPTQVNGQGNDHGSQYRSAIFYHSEQQKKEAEQKKTEVQQQHKKPIATEITQITEYYPAEEYHQRYLEKGGQCAIKGDKTKIRCYG